MTDTWQAVFIIPVSSVTLRKRDMAREKPVTGNDYKFGLFCYWLSELVDNIHKCELCTEGITVTFLNTMYDIMHFFNTLSFLD